MSALRQWQAWELARTIKIDASEGLAAASPYELRLARVEHELAELRSFLEMLPRSQKQPRPQAPLHALGAGFQLDPHTEPKAETVDAGPRFEAR